MEYKALRECHCDQEVHVYGLVHRKLASVSRIVFLSLSLLPPKIKKYTAGLQS